MKVTVDFCLIPLGAGISFSTYIAQCQRILKDAGLHHELYPFGTCIEGEWEPVMAAVQRCHEAIHRMGAPRVFTTLKIGTRIDREQAMREKVDSVRRLLDEGDAQT